MLSRRRFMFLLGGAATGLWLASTGLVRLERNFVVSLAGWCSFCGKADQQIHALVGTPGHATKICDECVGLCCDILGEEVGIAAMSLEVRSTTSNFEDERFQRHVTEVLERFSAENEVSRKASLLDDLRGAFVPRRREPVPDFACSFCDAHRRDVRKLITGPRVFICDACVGDAAAVVTHVLRT